MLNCRLIGIAALLLGLASPVIAQENEAPWHAFGAAVDQMNADIANGKHTPAELAGDLKQLDLVFATENGRRSDLAADILLQKGMLYSQLFDDPVQAKTFFVEIKNHYATTKYAEGIDDDINAMDAQLVTKKIRASMGPGTAFPDFSVTNATGQALSAAKYRGRVVLVDFWATWCPLCIKEMPNVAATYGKYHDRGFEVIGISLDDAATKLTGFTADHNMLWPQYCDGHSWSGALPVKYGVTELPSNVLVDTAGNIIAWNVTGDALPKAVAKALAK